MLPVRDFRDLIVWQKSADLAVEIYRLTARFPREELYGMTGQARRAAVSVVSNIAEGSTRSTPRGRRSFYEISQGSLKETESILLVSQRLGFCGGSDCQVALELASEIGRMLTGMRRQNS